MTDVTTHSSRHGLPFLATAQAQKEITHNEALALIDLVLNASADAMLAVPPVAPEAGRCWIVAAGATGAWSGREGQMAGWTAGGWRFVAMPVGASVRVGDIVMRRQEDGWTSPPTIALPTGGDVVDSGARLVLSQLVELFRAQGVIGG